MTQAETNFLMETFPSVFAEKASGFKLDSWQIKAMDSQSNRLLFCCSRQSGKSFCAASIALHEAVYSPGALILIISFNLDQSKEMIKKITDLSRWLDIPPMPEFNKKSLGLENGSRIISLSATEQAVRSWSPTTIIVDEASRCKEICYLSARPALAATNGRLILLSSPNGTRGFFYKAYQNTEGEGWAVFEVTADKCPRISKEFLVAERKVMTERLYLQEYFCKFLDFEGQLLSSDLLRDLIDPDLKPFKFVDAHVDSEIKRFSYKEDYHYG